MDIPLAPVDLFQPEFDEDPEPEVQVQPVSGGATRFGAGAADLMPPPPVFPTQNVQPAYGLAGTPDKVVTTRDFKAGLTGFILGILAGYFFRR